MAKTKNNQTEENIFEGRFSILIATHRKTSNLLEIIEKLPEGLDHLKDKVRQTFIDSDYGIIRDTYFY